MQVLHELTPNWQQALNPKLVQRLWQPAQQPGLVRLRQAQILLTRHQRMTTGLPLAALAQRGGAMSDAGQVPIVYAQPLLTGNEPTMNSTAISHTGVHVHQAMPNAMPQPNMPTTQSTSDSETVVIQRKMAPGVTSNSASPESVPLPLAPMVASPMPDTPNGVQQSAAMMQQNAEATRPVILTTALPVVYPAPVLVDGAAVNVSSLANSPALPITRINTISTLPVVREQPAPERTTHSSSPVLSAQAQLPVQLPLVEVPHAQTATTSNATETQRIAPPLQPNTTNQISTTQPNQSTQSSQRYQPNQQNQLNVDEIVDKVHRKFLRRLTSEAERRGVR